MCASMASDPFDDLLGLEDNFYKEGYDAGVVDGEYAGLVEGKLFGIEKGYEKVFELGKLRGRAMVWQARSQQTPKDSHPSGGASEAFKDEESILALSSASSLPRNSRLAKHIDGLLAVTDHNSIAMDNSDEAVTECDERVSKAQAKAKVIAAIVGESFKLEPATTVSTGIEESTGLNARH